MNVFKDFKFEILKVIEDLQGEGLLPGDLDFTRVTCEPPREKAHGDISANAALVLSNGTQLRFLPAVSFTGGSGLSLRGLDDSYAGGYSSTAGGSHRSVLPPPGQCGRASRSTRTATFV